MCPNPSHPGTPAHTMNPKPGGSQMSESMVLAGTAPCGSILIMETQLHPPSSLGSRGICSCKLNSRHHKDVKLSINTTSTRCGYGNYLCQHPTAPPGQQGSRKGWCRHPHSCSLPTQPPAAARQEWRLWKQMGSGNGTPEPCPARLNPAPLHFAGFTQVLRGMWETHKSAAGTA